MGFVGIAAGECDLEFAGHLRSVNEVHEELRRGFGPGQHIKGFPGVHSGEGRTHDVAGIVSTAAIADNVHIQGVVHDGIYLFRHQVMQLHGLAGGEVHQGHLLFIQGADQEIQLVFRQTAGRGPQPQHVVLAVTLGIAAIFAGETLVVLFGQFSGMKRFSFFPEQGNRVPEHGGIQRSEFVIHIKPPCQLAYILILAPHSAAEKSDAAGGDCKRSSCPAIHADAVDPVRNPAQSDGTNRRKQDGKRRVEQEHPSRVCRGHLLY